MRRLTAPLCLAVAAACADLSAPTSSSPTEPNFLRLPSSEQGGRPLATTLTGAAEVPGPGDPDGSGTADITLNAGQSEVCFVLTVTGITPATAAHIHVGAVDVTGPIVVGLIPPTSGSSSGCVTAERELIRAILHDPSNYYVNVHNADFPAGALRGQLPE